MPQTRSSTKKKKKARFTGRTFTAFTFISSFIFICNRKRFISRHINIEEFTKSMNLEIHVTNEITKLTADNPENTVSNHSLAGLSCGVYGGPDDEIAQKEMVYWSDIPEDSNYKSPFHDEDEEEKYMTFEPDGGGWNNIRMAMETIVLMAHAMGRTLVLPPSQKMYLLGKMDNGQKVHFSFADFFHLESIFKEHQGIKIITMEEFLKRTAMQGRLVDKDTGQIRFPPNNRTDWEGRAMRDKELFEYLRQVTDVRNWKPNECLAAFPASKGKEHIDNLQHMMTEVSKKRFYSIRYRYNPVAVDATAIERLGEARGPRNSLCVYDEEMQKSLVVHFMCYHKERARLLTHFYGFLFFEDWKHDLWAKRFVRDHLRYIDELQCAAARVVQALRKIAVEKHADAEYDSFHIRRGDFQYKMTRIGADEIYENSKDVLESGRTVYIATDERDRDFFAPLAEHYDLYFLDDFSDLIKDLNSNYYGMLDQLVASKGRTFVGTFYSTFTGYINRMRGYHTVKNKLDGYEDGTIQSYYFAPLDRKNEMRRYSPVTDLFAREFPISWKDLDKDIQ